MSTQEGQRAYRGAGSLNAYRQSIFSLIACLLSALMLLCTLCVNGIGAAFLAPLAAWVVAHRRSTPAYAMLLAALLGAVGLLLLPWQDARNMVGAGLIGVSAVLSLWSAWRISRMIPALRRYASLAKDAEQPQSSKKSSLILSVLLCLLLPLPAVLIGIYAPVRASFCAFVLLLPLTLAAFNNPIDRQTEHKLTRYLTLRERGEENIPLKKQLDNRLVSRWRQPFFIRAVICVLRALYPHHLIGQENIHQDDENPLIFLSNHGDVYGPVACMLHIPCDLKPWVISNIVVDTEETAAYLHRYNFGPATFLPERLKWPISRLVARISNWAMVRQLDVVPVFRDHPRQLMNTFRNASDAMQCGDNMLIFPENPNALAQDHGYEHEGIGPLFSGFAMLAPIYYNRTGKRCRFMPLYAHKGNRTLHFGQEVQYDPDNSPIDERDRLVTEISNQLNELYQAEEARYAKSHA